MGFDQKVVIKKFEGSHDLHWVGDKNLARYDDEFEKFFQQNSKDYFNNKAQQWFSTLTCHEYVEKINSHLKQEETNADFYLQEQTKPKIINIVLTECIDCKAEDLTNMEMGCTYMFDNRKIDQLKLMYDVFLRVDTTLKFVIQKMDPFIMQEGKKIITNEELRKDPIKFTIKLLDLKAEMDQIISQAFNNDMRFQKARDVAFQNFMNEFDRTPQYIAFYMDKELKSGFKQLNEEEIERKIEAVIKLFCCLLGRDVFISAYSNLLANRLLNKTSVSDSAEQRMI